MAGILRDDKLILISTCYKWPDGLASICYYDESKVSFDNKQYTIETINKNEAEPFIVKISKDRVSKGSRRIEDCDNGKLYFLILNTEDKRMFSLWITFGEWRTEWARARIKEGYVVNVMQANKGTCPSCNRELEYVDLPSAFYVDRSQPSVFTPLRKCKSCGAWCQNDAEKLLRLKDVEKEVDMNKKISGQWMENDP